MIFKSFLILYINNTQISIGSSDSLDEVAHDAIQFLLCKIRIRQFLLQLLAGNVTETSGTAG